MWSPVSARLIASCADEDINKRSDQVFISVLKNIVVYSFPFQKLSRSF